MIPLAESQKPTGVVMGDPGGIAELPWAAAGLCERGGLDCYITPFSGATPASLNCLMTVAPPLAQRVRLELKRRRLPTGLNRSRVVQSGSWIEGAYVLARRANAPDF